MPQNKDAHITVRLSSKAKNTVNENAKKLGMSASQYLRMVAELPVDVLQNYADQESKSGLDRMLVFDKTTAARLIRESNAIGRNINQIARSVNTIANKNWLRAERAEEYLNAPWQVLKNVETEFAKLKELTADIASLPIINADKIG